MEVLTQIPVKRVHRSALLDADYGKLEFGRYVSDHMLVCDFNHEEWQPPIIVPFTNLSINPATLALHYGQTVFEGMKAFRMVDGRINIFRIEKHYNRFARSLDRMCMAIPPKEIFIEGLRQLVTLDKAWVPKQDGSALYLRPFVYASEARFGVKISEQYRFIIFTGPVPELYTHPIKVKVETDYVRAVKGGTGFAKCGGNYGAAFYPTRLAREKGYDQVLWTDGRENKFIEESGTMNVMFVINNKIVTPPSSDSILDGVTRDSLLQLADEMGIQSEIKPVSIDELDQAFRENMITEAFGAGTAAVLAPIKTININGIDYHLPAYNGQTIHEKLKARLERIRTGKEEDVFNWNFIL